MCLCVDPSVDRRRRSGWANWTGDRGDKHIVIGAGIGHGCGGSLGGWCVAAAICCFLCGLVDNGLSTEIELPFCCTAGLDHDRLLLMFNGVSVML